MFIEIDPHNFADPTYDLAVLAANVVATATGCALIDGAVDTAVNQHDAEERRVVQAVESLLDLAYDGGLEAGLAVELIAFLALAIDRLRASVASSGDHA